MTIEPASAAATAQKLRRLNQVMFQEFEANLGLQTEIIVEQEYQRQFDTAGAYFGQAWQKAGGTKNRVTLDDTGAFRNSFTRGSGEWRASRTSRGANFTFRIRNPHKKPRMDVPFVELLENAKDFQLKIRGDSGGISADGQQFLRRSWEFRFAQFLIQVGFMPGTA